MNCYICETELDKSNQTDEHIIINAAGGRLKSKNLICIKCNSTLGDTIDSKLAKQLNDIANFLIITRHRGEPQPVVGHLDSTGEKYLLEVGGTPKRGNPIIKKTTNGNRTEISITARDIDEMKKILKDIQKKYPYFSIEEALNNLQDKSEYLQNAIHIEAQVGGEEVFRAVCKSAINYYVYKNGSVSQIKHLIPYILGQVERNIVWMHYEKNIYEIKPDEVFHAMRLIANSNQRTLYCYVDYFSTYRYLVLLNDNYEGPGIDETYCYDLINLAEIKKDIRTNYDREKLLRFFSNRNADPFEEVQNAFTRTLRIADTRQRNYQIQKIYSSSLKNVFEKYPDGTIISEEILQETLKEFTKNIAPFIANNLKHRSHN